MLHASDIKKSYGQVDALRGVDLSVNAGQIVALLGRNGAGKTTLVSIVAGLLRADAGTVEVDGVDAVAQPGEAARRIGVAPQETGVYRVLTVRENLTFFADLAGVPKRNRSKQVDAVAEQLGLTDLLGRKGSELSGGESRRLHTACALVHRPRLLLLDEPTVGADVATRQQLIEAVGGLAADGAAVVYTTHYLPEVEALNADIVIIHEGRILDRGTQAELIERHHRGGLWFTVEGEPPPGVLDGLDVMHRQTEGDDQHRFLVGGDVRMADLVDRFGAQASQLVSVERNLPDLDRVFMTVTGESSEPDEQAAS